jgi:hypothetical protein
VSEATVTGLPTALQGKEIDFGYFSDGNHISNYLNAPASVKVSSGKVTINLGAVKSENLRPVSISSGVTVIPSSTLLKLILYKGFQV